jgi:hypothetical protein
MIYNQHFIEKLSFSLDESYEYEIEQDGKIIDHLRLVVKMNDYGEFYFVDGSNNKLFFYRLDGLFYFYKYMGGNSYLKTIFKIVPKIPLVTSDIKYEDYISSNLLYSQFKSDILLFLASFNYNFYIKVYNYSLKNNILTSSLGKIVFDTYNKGFKEISFNNTTIRIKKDEKNSIA